MVGKVRSPLAAQREEADESPSPSGPTTLRPESGDPEDSAYAKLRDSCRVAAAHVPDPDGGDTTDDELAIEADVVRVAFERRSQRPRD
jgi:hypothetical protein